MKVKEFLKENRRILICTALAIIAGALIGVSIGIALTPMDKGAEVASIEMACVGPNTVITANLSFTGCAHGYEKTIDNALHVGETREELSEKFPYHTVLKFTQNEVVLDRRIDGCCRLHYALISSGTSALTLQKFNEETLRMEDKADIALDITALDAAVQDELLSGVVFDSMDAVNAYLEGLES